MDSGELQALGRGGGSSAWTRCWPHRSRSWSRLQGRKTTSPSWWWCSGLRRRVSVIPDTTLATDPILRRMSTFMNCLCLCLIVVTMTTIKSKWWGKYSHIAWMIHMLLNVVFKLKISQTWFSRVLFWTAHEARISRIGFSDYLHRTSSEPRLAALCWSVLTLFPRLQSCCSWSKPPDLSLSWLDLRTFAGLRSKTTFLTVTMSFDVNLARAVSPPHTSNRCHRIIFKIVTFVFYFLLNVFHFWPTAFIL